MTQQVMSDSLEALPVSLSSPEAPPYSPLTPPTWYEEWIISLYLIILKCALNLSPPQSLEEIVVAPF